MRKTIAIANQKGGVGKTTTAVNLAAALGIAERDVLLLDCDPQGNATSGTGVKGSCSHGTVYDAILHHRSIEAIIKDTDIPCLKVAPSSIDLIGAELELVDDRGRERKLLHALQDLPDFFEFVIVDCPPSLSLLTLNALTAADSVIIPLQCEYYALEGVSQILKTIDLVKKTLNSNLSIEGMLLTMYDSRNNLSRRVVDEVRGYFGDKVFNTVINRNVRLSESPSFGKPIMLYDIYSRGSANYLDLARELLLKN